MPLINGTEIFRSNDNLYIDIFVKDDGSPDNMSCHISLTLYYK